MKSGYYIIIGELYPISLVYNYLNAKIVLVHSL
jgi:hypothetical protein